MANTKFGLAALDSFCERTLKAAPPKIPKYGYRGQEQKIPSHMSSAPFVASVNKQVYTGTAMIGVATLHKSNAVPVFSEQDAKDISKMRR